MRRVGRPVAVLALGLASCSLAPAYRRPAAPVESRWPASAGESRPGVAADLGWRDVFGDPRLGALVALALENNRDLRVAALDVELAGAEYRIQRAQAFPSVVGSATGGTQHVGATSSATGTPYTVTQYGLSVAVPAFELDLFGKVKSLRDQALEQYLATEEARRSAHLSLVAAVARQYLAARALDAQVVLARQTLDTVQASYEITKRTSEVGKTSELDLKTAEAQVETARFNLAVYEQQRNEAQNALVLLVGCPLPEDLPAPLPLDAQPIVADLPAGLPSDLLQRRPDILGAEHALRAANASIGAARAAFFPSITLTAAAGTLSPDLSGLFGGGTGLWSFLPRIDVPIFTGGRNRANLDATEVRKKIEIARYEKAIQVAFREVADALAARATIEAQLAAETARVQAESRRYELSDLRYRKGVDNYLTVLTAQRDLYTAQQQLIQTRLARLVNLVGLYQALGGGWLESSAAARPGAGTPSQGAPEPRSGTGTPSQAHPASAAPSSPAAG